MFLYHQFYFLQLHIVANFSTLSSNIAAQNYTQPEFPSISANFTNRVSISTALIGDSSIIADCTNNFIEKIDQNEKQGKADIVATVDIPTINC